MPHGSSRGRGGDESPPRRTVYGRPSRADDELRAELDAALAKADEFDPNRVDVLVADGVVVMLGTVASREIKRRLGELCGHVRGVRELHDQLQISDGD